MSYDFSGYATRNDTKCTDGRTIRRNAFVDNDGKTVPLVWQHRHDSPENVIGHADLENREDGVYAYGYFNNTDTAKTAKELVKNGDISSLSIYANHLIEKDGFVMHGSIKEVSLVLAGANPGAFIDNIAIQHADGSLSSLEDEAIFFNDSTLDDLEHSDKKDEDDKESNNEDESKSEETVEDIFNTLSEKQKDVAYYLIGQAKLGMIDPIENEDSDKSDEEELEHEDSDSENIGSIYDSMTDKQKQIVKYLMVKALDEYETENKNIEHSDEGGNTDMKYNVFESEETQVNTLSHADFSEILADAKKTGSLKEAVMAHADEAADFANAEHGITNIDLLFPDDQLVNKKIEMIRNNPADWVARVMSSVHKSPFSRIKMLHTNLTADEARARGYVKGTRKVSEVIPLFKRTVAPTTIYKAQRLDRDDIIDITDMDIVAWLKAEMRIMLEEELARAFLVGDARDASIAGTEKINESCIIPILKDYSSDLYAIRHSYSVGSDEDAYTKFIDECVLAMVDYEGTGSPTLFTTPEQVARMLLIKDSIGNRIYKTKAELANAIGVKDIVEVPYMKNVKSKNADEQDVNSMHIDTEDGGKMLVKGIIVNLNDYTVGADKGGAVNMFDDFDIDFNQYKYLMETRCSGALTKPHSALLVGEVVSAG